MKLLLLTFLLTIFPQPTPVEYNGHHVEFVMELKDGSSIHGYIYKPVGYTKDASVSYSEFLEKNYDVLLQNDFIDGLGDYAYFKNRFRYEYKDWGSEDITAIYNVTEKTSIDINSIKSFKIIDIIDQSYAVGVSMYNTEANTTWMKSDVVERFSTGDNLCSHDIFIHVHNPQTKKVLSALKKLDQEYLDHIKFLELELRSYDGAERQKIEEDLEKYEDAQGDKVDKLLRGFDNQKVVIVTFCSC
jgi:hypothetical protein